MNVERDLIDRIILTRKWMVWLVFGLSYAFLMVFALIKGAESGRFWIGWLITTVIWTIGGLWIYQALLGMQLKGLLSRYQYQYPQPEYQYPEPQSQEPELIIQEMAE